MDGQMIISVGREFGSGGHVIAEALAKRFGLPLYDSNLLEHIAQEKNIDPVSYKHLCNMQSNGRLEEIPDIIILKNWEGTAPILPPSVSMRGAAS